jgi:WD40 repeat protein
MFRMLLREAEQRRLPVIPLLVRGVEQAHQAVAAHGISDLQWIDLRRDDHVGDLEHLTEMISAPQHVTPQVAAAPPNPYPGAAPFSEDQQQFFVGRDDELAALGEEFGRHDVVLLSGGSGVGKTSLVHAALVPFVRRSIGPFAASGTQGWVVRYSDASAAQTLDGFSPDAHDQTFCIVDHIDVFVERQPAEEWTRRAERIAALLRSGRQRGKVLLVWRESLPDTLRDEALRAWEAAAGSPPGRFALNKVPPVVLRRTLEEPSIKVGHLFEPGLLDRLVGDAGEGSGAIAQAQLAMADIWAERRQGWLTNKAYDAEGGIAGRFEKRLQAYLHQAGPDSAHIAELLLLRLIRFDTQLRTIAEARSWSDVASLPVLGSGHAERIRDALIAGRLIDVWRESSDAPMRCALAHGTVPPTLQALATSDVEFILWRERFATHLHSFVDADRASTALLSGDVLAEAERWASSRSDELTTVETELIAASREAREQERTDAARREEELARSRAQTQLAEVEATLSRRRTTVFRRAAWAVSVLAVLAFLAFVVALQNYRRASSLEERERLSRLAAQTGRLADRARDIRSRDNPEDLDLIALVAIEALRLGPSGDADLQIREAIRLLGQPLARLDHDGSMKFVGWGPTTDYVVALPEGREALVWKWTDFQVISRHAHTARINSIAVSSDGTTAATAAANGEVHVWPIFASAEFMNLQDHQALGSAPDQPRPGVNAVAFGAAGQLLATGSDDGMVRLWDLTTQRVMARAKHEASVHAVAFSRDDSDPVLVTAGDDGGARVWRLPDLQLLYRVPHPGAVTFLGFADERESGGLSPDRPRRLLVTGGFEGELKFWPVGALNPTLRLALRGDVVSAGSDADRTLTGLLNRFGSSAKDADVVLLSRTLARRVGRDAVNLLGAVRPAKRYSISGSGLVAMGPGRVAGVWEPEPGIEEARQERARLLHDGPVTAADLRDGMALTAGSDGIVRVWRLPENASRGEQAAFYSPDGQWRLSETADGSLGLERLPLQGEPHTLPVPFSQIFRVAFFQHRVAVVYMNRLALLDLRSETVLADVPLNDQDPVRTLAIAEGGVLVAFARAVELRAPDTAAPLWRVDFSDPLEPMPVGIDPVSDELDVALLRDGTLQVWPRPRRTSYPLSVDVARSVRFMAFRPRRRQFAVCGDSRVAVVNTDNGRASWTSDIDAPCSAIAFDRSGNSLAVATFAGEAPPAFPPGEAGPRSRGILRVFEPDTAVRPPALESPLRIDRLAFTTDGAVVAGRAGNVVHVWDIPSEREVARIPVTASTPSAGVSFVDGRQLSFSQDNRYLHIGGTPTPWRPNDVIAEACQRLTRRLSAEEVRAHLPVDHVYTPACTIDRRVAAK